MISRLSRNTLARVAFVLFWPAVAVIVWGEMRAPGQNPMIWDKALHFIAYFGLGGLITVAFKARPASIWGVLAVILLGGVLEIVQGLTGRDMSAWDEVANTLGAICGGLAGWAFYSFYPRLVERLRRS